MLLSSLLKDVHVISEYDDCEVYDVCCNSNSDLNSVAFVCIKGDKYDGNDFSKLALQKGAAVIITEKEQNLPRQVIVTDARKAYALMCKALNKNAADDLLLIATTGTNGKTSVTTIISSILERATINSGYITTISARYNDYTSGLSNTTPDPHVLHKILFDMKKLGCAAVCLEASSHSLCQERLFGIKFDVSVFTNLTQDHLDYHGGMEDYYQAKKKLFSKDYTRHAIINIDDEYGLRLTNEIEIPFSTYSVINRNATFFADNIVYNNDGVSFTMHHEHIESKISFAIPGLYSVKNALAAIAATKFLGISIGTISSAVAGFDGIMGRSEIIKTNRDFTILCDYAHTPDGLFNIIKSTKEYAKGRVIVVFGCGGDRDRTKRAQMGAIATGNADFTVITSDNPRTESGSAIINDIIKGAKPNSEYIALINRSDAIRYAISIAKRNDIIILAGKGHELYSQVGNVKLYYDERKIVHGVLSSMDSMDIE